MKRIIFCYSFLLLFMAIGVLRIGIITNQKSNFAAAGNSSKTLEIATVRGTIFDKNGMRLTDEIYDYIAAVPPTKNAVNAVAKYLSPADKKTLKQGFPVAVRVEKSFFSSFVQVFKIPRRYSNIATHLIGYCDENGNGICGVEKAFNKTLKGEKIKINFKTDGLGRVIETPKAVEKNYDFKQNGVMLTIDKPLQLVCEDIARKNINCGAIVVLENKTGKIRAMVSAPNFDQNNISSSLDSENSPFFNRAIAPYNIGSLFKILVSAAALYYNVNLNFYCNGFLKIGDTRFNCLAQHKKTDMNRAICLSCNCYFIRLSQKIGAKRLLDFAKSFGFGNEIKLCSSIISTGATLPELSSLLLKPAELANFSFGQGVILTSPLQVASMLQCVANLGKKLTPTLIEGACDYKGKLISPKKQALPTFLLSKSDAKTLQKYMINTVEYGTGMPARPNHSSAGGKTATAQTGIFDKQGNMIYQAWFGGFYSAKNPAYTIVVLCENGESGSKTAAPIFKKIAEAINNIG